MCMNRRRYRAGEYSQSRCDPYGNSFEMRLSVLHNFPIVCLQNVFVWLALLVSSRCLGRGRGCLWTGVALLALLEPCHHIENGLLELTDQARAMLRLSKRELTSDLWQCMCLQVWHFSPQRLGDHGIRIRCVRDEDGVWEWKWKVCMPSTDEVAS